MSLQAVEMSELDTMDARRQTECLRKHRYSPRQARALMKALRIMRRDGKEVTSYACEHCGGRHITNVARSKRRHLPSISE